MIHAKAEDPAPHERIRFHGILQFSFRLSKLEPKKIFLAHLQSEWVILECFSYGFEHTGQDFQAEILLIA